MHVCSVDFPDGIRGACTQDAPNAFTIALNSKATEAERAAAFLHECLHIYHGDHDSDKAPDQIEEERHRELLEVLRILENKIGG